MPLGDLSCIAVGIFKDRRYSFKVMQFMQWGVLPEIWRTVKRAAPVRVRNPHLCIMHLCSIKDKSAIVYMPWYCLGIYFLSGYPTFWGIRLCFSGFMDKRNSAGAFSYAVSGKLYYFCV